MMPLFLWLAVPALQAVAPAPNPFAPLEFLLGDWVGEGGGGPGQGAGAFTFTLELEGRVLVRRNHADYPATETRPASRHEDLMVVFRDDSKLRAHYYDNEGHVIRYEISGPDGQGGVQFVSDAAAPGPHFRLTYTPSGKDRLLIRFDIAPPGQPNGFKTYIKATAKRRNPSGTARSL